MDFSIEPLRPLVDLVVAAVRRDPAVTQQQQILVAAVAFLLVVLVVVLLLLVFTPRKRRVLRRRRVVRVPAAVGAESSIGETVDGWDEGGGETAAEPAAGARFPAAARALIGVPAMIILVLLIVVATYSISGTTMYCTYWCHQDLVVEPEPERPAPLTATTIPTATVEPADVGPVYHTKCTGCHDSDIITNVSDRTRMIAVTLAGSSETSASAVVESRDCVSCHRDVLSGTVTGRDSNVRMSHAEPYDAGMACILCHVRTGHVGSRSPEMSSCLECHDAEQVSTACEGCHEGSPSDQSTRDEPAGSASRRVYRLVQLSADRCYECHDPRPCDSCHGVRVPHTARFVEGRHGYPAAWDGKRTCYRCHELRMCQNCHQSFAGSHYEGWRRDHRSVSPTARCSCHDRRRPERTEPFCTVCH
jgi:hypothetical protein